MEPPQTDLRVMVDANILLAGSIWPRWPYEVLQHALRGDFRLVLSEYVIKQVITHIQRRFPAYQDQFEAFIKLCPHEIAVDPTAEQVTIYYDLVRDPTDVPVALAAINAGVDYLISEDKDLTVTDKTTSQLRQSLRVMISGTFLREVMGWSSQDLEMIRHRTWHDLYFNEP